MDTNHEHGDREANEALAAGKDDTTRRMKEAVDILQRLAEMNVAPPRLPDGDPFQKMDEYIRGGATVAKPTTELIDKDHGSTSAEATTTVQSHDSGQSVRSEPAGVSTLVGSLNRVLTDGQAQSDALLGQIQQSRNSWTPPPVALYRALLAALHDSLAKLQQLRLEAVELAERGQPDPLNQIDVHIKDYQGAIEIWKKTIEQGVQCEHQVAGIAAGMRQTALDSMQAVHQGWRATFDATRRR